MKTKKEMLKFFLKKIELWDLFSSEVRNLHLHFGAPEWSCVDNDLKFLFNAISLADLDPKEFRVLSRLRDRTYLDQLITNEDLGSLTLVFALSDLCEYVGLEPDDQVVWEYLPEEASIMEIVEQVYFVALAQNA